ncbi:MAG: MarC family protein [Rhodospirillales bacterium]|jgi:multiple antibiotic resistance protein|nr:MarC family protein [Rhodospirillales bacterium]MDP7652556.1 MarC family protein [Rhodospirillales bacterium]
MWETGLFAFTTFFATIGPVDAAAVFAALTPNATPRQRRAMAIKGTLIAAAVLIVFMLFGNDLLAHLGITLAAMRTAGGILLLLIAIDMVFARHSGGTSATADESEEAGHKADISVFPLATPMIAGPGAMGAVVLLSAESQGDLERQAVVMAALLAVLALTFLLLLIAGGVQRVLGVTGSNVITRVVGVLLAALAVQFIFDGIAASGLVA